MAPKFMNLYVLLRITFSLFEVFNYKMEQNFLEFWFFSKS